MRAIFDDAGNIIPGEDVKIDGVKVGTVTSVTPTPPAKAAVVLNITNPGFQDFRADASCTIRPQALIGEKYVDCLPTQPRVEGTPLPPPLPKIPSRLKARASTCCRSRTHSSPVDVDLLGDINRLPERQRLTIIINELGAGLAGRGSDLNEVIRRANPALREFDKVLCDPRRARTRCWRSWPSTPTTRSRRSRACASTSPTSSSQSNTVAQASAAQRGALAAQPRSCSRRSCASSSPAMERLERFADQTTADVHRT